MKTTLTPEQSATLIAKGISADKASEQGDKIFKPFVLQNGSIKRVFDSYEPIFTLADIIGLLPKQIGTNTLYLDYLSNGKVESGYRGERKSFGILHLVIGDELIDSLYELLLWAIDNGHINLTK